MRLSRILTSDSNLLDQKTMFCHDRKCKAARVYALKMVQQNFFIMGKGDLHSLDQVVIFDKGTCLDKLKIMNCPPLALKHLLVLTSLKTLTIEFLVGLVGAVGAQGDLEWQLPIKYMKVGSLHGNSEKELTELIPHLPRLSKLEIMECKNIKQLVECQGLQTLLTTGGQLNKLKGIHTPRLFAGWDHNPRWALEDIEVEDQQTQLV